MAYIQHRHPVYDTDLHYVIDPITRQIKSECGKVQFMQYDHNSERITFAIPRYVDGHDMSLCNASEVHYINTSKADKTVFNAEVYPIVDLQIHPEDDQVVIGSWLVSQNATKYCGSLAFIVRFACIEDTEITYQWHTDIYKDIKIVSGIYNTSVVTNDDDRDVLAAWKKEVFEMMEPYFEETRKQAEQAAQSAEEAGEYAAEAGTHAETAKTEAANAEASAEQAAIEVEKAKVEAEKAEAEAIKAAQSAVLANQSEIAAKEAEAGAMQFQSVATVKANEAVKSAQQSADSALLSKSWAVGDTGVRTGENTNNSKYYSEAAKGIHAESLNVLAEAKETLAEVNKVNTNVEFSFDFETGELVYVSPQFIFGVNHETGNLEWEVA